MISSGLFLDISFNLEIYASVEERGVNKALLFKNSKSFLISSDLYNSGVTNGAMVELDLLLFKEFSREE